jgi:HSP20 family protein
MQEELEELFADLWQVPGFAGMRRGFRPHVDCYRTEAHVVVLVELAGVDPADVELAVVEQSLLVRGTRKRPPAPSGASFHQLEVEYGPFERRVSLGVDVDSDGADATFERGLLRIELPVARRPPAQRMRITIRRLA